ncbi:MAG: type I-U CRISPR-associated helicase/endonuclease Cas3 [Gammaproteobacteria bacterium]|nr:type I-U CRISPR-associated helicase/endonuclease Cas3 [Gammaproteobacteria bacterium]
MHLRAQHFAEFLVAVHGHAPFPWQQRLVDELAATDAWPDLLHLPSGAGKTVAVDAAVFHLALRHHTPGRAALRICTVVDRHLVMDHTFAHACQLAAALAQPANAAKGPKGREVVAEVARRLGSLAESPDRPLVAQRLRGGVPLEPEWARTPTQPVVLCSTVDQVGSRLLHRGYGVSARMRPVHAGLLGQNTLVLIDEAHAAEPFLQTLEAIRTYGRADTRTVLMAATPPSAKDGQARRKLALSDADLHNPVLVRRLRARKPASMVKVPRNRPAGPAFFKCVLAARQNLAQQGVANCALAVVTNRADLARRLFEELRGRDDFDAVLLIGRCRSVESESSVAERLAPFRTGAPERANARPLVIVATQGIEAAVDIDLDALVTQAAPLDALRQRAGRLNRGGRDIRAPAWILALGEDVGRSPDPVYGDRIRRTWEKCKELGADDTIDLGGTGPLATLTAEEGAALSTQRDDAPVLMPAYLDLWSQTSPAPGADPDVSLFFHGKGAAAGDVSLVWRADIALTDLRAAHAEALSRIVALMPPQAAEAVQVPVAAARAFLADRRPQAGAVADIPGQHQDDNPDRSGRFVAFRWAGTDAGATGLVAATEIRPGDVLVLPAELGGCDRYGWHPGSRAPVRDVADRAAAPFVSRRVAVRVSRDVVYSAEDWRRLVTLLDRGDMPIEPDFASRVREELTPEADRPASPQRSIRSALAALAEAPGGLAVHAYPPGLASAGGAVLVWSAAAQQPARHAVSFPSTEDDAGSHSAPCSVLLDQHSEAVAKVAGDAAATLGLDAATVEDVVLAARLHDAGKADRRFQAMLAGGDDWNVPPVPLAKSARASARAWQMAGLPPHWRHEAQSVRLCLAHPHFQANDPALVLWLVGTHHGLGRPFFGFAETAEDPEVLPCLGVSSWPAPATPGPESLAFAFRGETWPELFDTLRRRYGVWGLAHLEAIVRLADHRASEATA